MSTALEQLKDSLEEFLDTKEEELEQELEFLQSLQDALGTDEAATTSATSANLDEILGQFGFVSVESS